MSRSDTTWPARILSGRAFLGGGAPSKAVGLDWLVRLADPAHGAALLRAAAAQGIGAVMPMNDAATLAALDRARADTALEVFPIIPNALGYVRDATDHGMVGAGLKHLRRLGLRDLLGIGLRSVPRAPRVLRRDFPTLLAVLVDVEMAVFRRYRPRLVLLHAQVTDIAVALGNVEALRVFADLVRRRYGAEPGLATSNFGLLLPHLRRTGLDLRVVVAPFNARGFLMKPTRDACEALLAAGDVTVIADRLGIDGPDSWPADFAYLDRLGIRSAVLDSGEFIHTEHPSSGAGSGAFSVPPLLRVDSGGAS